ncbi:CHAP domain-containing protein [Candidatus Saccharibacteria bacterium]|nr:CHAP domain-containing protein [Candidatus Saccharibacteria bacterium]
METNKNKNTNNWWKVLGYALVVMAMVFSFVLPTMAYNCKPGDTECEKAKANMKQSQADAANYTEKASSVSEIIEQLEGEITTLNNMIAENETKIKKLNIEIEKKEEKLEEERSALAELLVNMHFSSDAEPILVLAGSTSISDLAEKAAREEIAKQEIVVASEKVKEAKEELNAQKTEVETTLAANEQSRLALASKKESQKELKASYENSADEAAAVASYWEEQVKAMSWTPPVSSSGNGTRWTGAGNSYPYQNVCSYDFDYSAPGNWVFPYGGLICQCTDYVSYKALDVWGVANTWGGDAWAYIYGGGRAVPVNGKTTYVNSVPAPNSIAIWPAAYAGATGHVAWVESVNGDGSINITEYNVNWPANGCYEKDFCSRSGVGTAGVNFLHFE